MIVLLGGLRPLIWIASRYLNVDRGCYFNLHILCNFQQKIDIIFTRFQNYILNVSVCQISYKCKRHCNGRKHPLYFLYKILLIYYMVVISAKLFITMMKDVFNLKECLLVMKMVILFWHLVWATFCDLFVDRKKCIFATYQID